MCFSTEMSFAFACGGIAVAMVAWLKLNALGGAARRGAPAFVTGVLYFVVMEFLQAISYRYIDDGSGSRCRGPNAALTVAGFAHICFQPYFTHLMCGAFYNPKGTRGVQNAFTLRLCLIAGIAFFMRYVLAAHAELPSYAPPGPGANREWIRASTDSPAGPAASCTSPGVYHLAWSVPLYQPTYFSPSVYIHSFMMFAPFLVSSGLQPKLFGAFLFATGPLLSAWITPNLCAHEMRPLTRPDSREAPRDGC